MIEGANHRNVRGVGRPRCEMCARDAAQTVQMYAELVLNVLMRALVEEEDVVW
jgi:hypothetical protein